MGSQPAARPPDHAAKPDLNPNRQAPTSGWQTFVGFLGAGPHPLANRCGQDQALALGAAVGLPAVSVKRILDRVPA
jgi:hypothetical protein